VKSEKKAENCADIGVSLAATEAFDARSQLLPLTARNNLQQVFGDNYMIATLQVAIYTAYDDPGTPHARRHQKPVHQGVSPDGSKPADTQTNRGPHA
jgi:hypothetical protein